MLATIVQLDPIYVNFNVSERDVLRVRDMLDKRGADAQPICSALPVEVGLQTDQGYPHKGTLDYIAPTVNQGDRHARGARRTAESEARLMLPGFFVRVRVPLAGGGRRCSCRPSRSAAIRAAATCWSSTARTSVEQRKVEIGPAVGEHAVIESGLKADDRVIIAGLLRAIPGQKVDPQTQTAAK